MFDLVVSGGTHVLPSGTTSVDLAVAGGKIVAIAGTGSLAALGAVRVIDAAGQIVIPGGVDPHIHCSAPMVMPNQPEPTVSAPPSQVSKAALFSGTTTLIDFVPVAGDATIREAIELRLKDWTGACYCDYGLHLMLFDHISPKSSARSLRRCRRVTRRSRCSPRTLRRRAWRAWCHLEISGR